MAEFHFAAPALRSWYRPTWLVNLSTDYHLRDVSQKCYQDEDGVWNYELVIFCYSILSRCEEVAVY